MSWDKEYIAELKAETYSAPMIEDNKTQNYRIKILHKGEQLFYYDKVLDRAIIIEIQIRDGSIFEKSIETWDDNENILKNDKIIIIDRVKEYFIKYQKMEAVVR